MDEPATKATAHILRDRGRPFEGGLAGLRSLLAAFAGIVALDGPRVLAQQPATLPSDAVPSDI